MPFRKLIINPNSGGSAEFWYITAFAVDARLNTCRVKLDGFSAPQYRQQPDGLPVQTRVYEINGDTFLALAGAPPIAQSVYGSVAKPLYQWIKTAPLIVPGLPPQPPEFADAEDI